MDTQLKYVETNSKTGESAIKIEEREQGMDFFHALDQGNMAHVICTC
jgi:hypothetical protein